MAGEIPQNTGLQDINTTRNSGTATPAIEVKKPGEPPSLTEQKKTDLQTANQLLAELEAPDGKVYQPKDLEDKNGKPFQDVFSAFKQLFAELFRNLFGITIDNSTSYDDLKAKAGPTFSDGDWDPSGRPEIVNQSMNPADLARTLADKYQKIKIDPTKINYNKYKDNDLLGKNQCSRFVSDILNLEQTVYLASELFGRLCAKPDQNGKIPNLKTSMVELKPGDVIFFYGTVKSTRDISHTGIIVSTEPLTMKHHSTFLQGVKTVEINDPQVPYYREHFYAAVTPIQPDDPFFSTEQQSEAI